MRDMVGRKLGQYQITGLIGRGGMAVVYRAHQESMGRDVALKVIKPDLAESAMGNFTIRFQREARLIASLSHSQILKVFDYGQESGLIYLVMELLTGGSLADLIRQAPLSLAESSRILNQLASALDHAHAKGIVHRDLKPQNILLDGGGNAVLTDFGIAKLLSETSALTQTGTAMGTPSYMAPEQWQNQALDGRADVYAAGIILYEMLTGHLPFEADTPHQMMYAHLNERPRPLRHFRGDLPDGVERVLEKALAKQPADRFQTVGKLADAFRTAMNGGIPLQIENNDLPSDATAPLRPDSGMHVKMPIAESAPIPTPNRPLGKWALAALGFMAFAVLLMAGIAVLGGGSTDAPATGSPLSAADSTNSTVPKNPSLTGSPTLNIEGLAAATIGARGTAAAHILESATPDLGQTLQAAVAATETLIAASASATATSTALPTTTVTSTFTASPPPPTAIPTNTAGALPTLTRAATVATPTAIPSTLPPSTAVPASFSAADLKGKMLVLGYPSDSITYQESLKACGQCEVMVLDSLQKLPDETVFFTYHVASAALNFPDACRTRSQLMVLQITKMVANDWTECPPESRAAQTPTPVSPFITLNLPANSPFNMNPLTAPQPLGGINTLNGVAFFLPDQYAPYAIITTGGCRGLNAAGEVVSFEANLFDIPVNQTQVEQVYFILAAGNPFTPYQGQIIGRITMQWSPSQASYIMLRLGENIRGWSRGGANAVERITSPDLQEAKGVEGIGNQQTGKLDIFTYTVPLANQSLRLEHIRIEDISGQIKPYDDPCIHLYAVTIKRKSGS